MERADQSRVFIFPPNGDDGVEDGPRIESWPDTRLPATFGKPAVEEQELDIPASGSLKIPPGVALGASVLVLLAFARGRGQVLDDGSTRLAVVACVAVVHVEHQGHHVAGKVRWVEPLCIGLRSRLPPETLDVKGSNAVKGPGAAHYDGDGLGKGRGDHVVAAAVRNGAHLGRKVGLEVDLGAWSECKPDGLRCVAQEAWKLRLPLSRGWVLEGGVLLEEGYERVSPDGLDDERVAEEGAHGGIVVPVATGRVAEYRKEMSLHDMMT